jgi:Short C-terminal domain
VIYRFSEEQAFTLVIDAYADILPKQSLDDITGARRGYESTWRWGLDTYSQKTLVVPAIGTDQTGREVRGYWFEVSGGGSSGSGRSKNLDLFRRLKTALDATGAAVVVTNLREGRYETDGRAYLGGSRDARDVAASRPRAPSAPKSTVADQLRELKTLRDQNLISDQEYEAKRRQILDRM